MTSLQVVQYNVIIKAKLQTRGTGMIVHRGREFWTLLFSCEGSIIPAISFKVLFGVIFGVVASVLSFYGHPFDYDFTGFTVFGVALSLFLGFRNNACYDRYIDQRYQWKLNQS